MIPTAGPVVPVAGTSYPGLLRADGSSRWRGLVGAVAGIALFVLLADLVSQAVVGLVWSVDDGGRPFAEVQAAARAGEIPLGLVAGNLGLAVLIAVAVLLVRLLHDSSPRWLVSVRGAVRWRYLLACLLISVVALTGVWALSLLVEPGGLSWAPQDRAGLFLLAIVLTSPLQAVAEEVFFRGYLIQALGCLGGRPWLPVVVSAVVFAGFHGPQDVWLFADRLAFGIAAGLLVWRTGGLEAACAAHVVNNLLAFGLATLTSSVAAARALQEIGPLDALFDVGGFVVVALLCAWAGRAMRVHTVVG